MITAITKADAYARLEREVRGRCVLCDLARGQLGAAANVLVEGAHAALVLTQYPVRWGHMLVITRAHVVSFAALSDEVYAEASALALRGARAVEHALSPARVFVASLGTAIEGLPMTTPHFHTHVVPVSDANDRPRDVLTWEHGVLEADEAEWSALRASLRDALRVR